MPRYVDEDEFVKRIKPYDTNDTVDKALYNFARNKIAETPTADVRENANARWAKVGTMTEYIVRETGFPGTIKQEVVGEIVRCKDCKYHDDEEPGMVYCPHVLGGWVPNDFFCSDGERREDEGVR